MSSESENQEQGMLLVLEADPQMLIAMRRALEGAGYRAAAAPDAEAALTLLEVFHRACSVQMN